MINEKIRNIAIIAHVDHGKTTLVDAILKQTAANQGKTEITERVMDSMDLEQERGITIKAKNASVLYKDIRINIIDTPGHADFGGEVERVLRMADGVLLLVDAKEGPMPQTKFVLKKALELGHKAIVVINKIDRPDARPQEVVDKTFDLFVSLGATDDQLDFPIVFASAIAGVASLDAAVLGKDLIPLFDLVVEKIPHPHGDVNAPLQILILNLSYDNYKGRIAIGRVDNGKITAGQQAVLIKKNGAHIASRITGLLAFDGMTRKEVPEISAGDIVALSGFDDVEIGETVADLANPVALPLLNVDEPTMEMMFRVNDGPMAGKEGKYCTSRNIKDRLTKELETNVSLRVRISEDEGSFLVAGRGELHLAILLEQMRRGGYELTVSRPEVIIKEVDGKKMEPFESLIIEVPEEHSGAMMEMVGRRKGIMENMQILDSGEQHYEFVIPTRGLLGLKNALMIATKGTALMHHNFLKYAPMVEGLGRASHGALVSMENGVAVGYALYNLQERGTLFISPGENVYVGMIIGESNRESDNINVNPIKEKKLTNVRSKASDEAIMLIPPRKLTLETALEFIDKDEYLEITPKSLRIRKKILDPNKRK